MALTNFNSIGGFSTGSTYIQVIDANANITGNSVIAGNIGNAATYLYGDGSNITGISVSAGTEITNGTTNVDIPATDGNVVITVAGTPQWTFDTTGNLTLPSTTANINYSNGSSILDGIGSNYGDSNVVSLLDGATLTTDVITSGTITGTTIGNSTVILVGDGGNISNIQGASVNGTVASAGSADSATTAGTVTANAQGNITSLGVLTSLSVTGDTILGDLYVAGNTISMNNTAITTEDLYLELATSTAFGPALNGAGIMVGSGNVATLTFNNTNYTWKTNVNFEPSSNNTLSLGNVSSVWSDVYASYLHGDGSNITGVVSSYGDGNVESLLSTGITSNIITTGVVTASTIELGNSTITTGNVTSNALSNAVIYTDTSGLNAAYSFFVVGVNQDVPSSYTATVTSDTVPNWVVSGTTGTPLGTFSVTNVGGNISLQVLPTTSAHILWKVSVIAI